MKLSIVTIAYNNLDGLTKTVESVVGQSFDDFEFIVVDGNSNDGTKKYLENASSRISKWVSEKDSGIYNAQNKGIDLAKGEFILFLNAGDILVGEDVLSAVFAQINSSTEIAYGDVVLSNKEGVYSKKIHPENISTTYLLKEVVAHQSQFIRRSLFLKYGKYNEQFKIAADYEFFARMFWENGVVLQHINLVTSNFDTEGLSSSPEQKRKIEIERKEIHKKYAPFLMYSLYYGYAKFCKLIGR